MPPETVDPPAEIKTETVLPNPVIPEGMDLSKKFFNDAMAAEKPTASEPEVVEKPETPAEEVKPGAQPEKTEKDPKFDQLSKDAGAVPTAPTTSERSKLPEELISGRKPEVKVDESIAEIDAMVLPKNAKPEQVASFAKLKEQSKKVIQEKLQRINELETKTSDGSTRAEIEAAQERVKTAEAKAKELESTIERLAYTESPKFKHFIVDESDTLKAAKSYFEGTEINPEIVEVAARSAGSQRIKVLTDAGADPNLVAAVAPYLAEYDAIQRKKVSALENWKTESTQWAESQRAQQEAAVTQRRASEDKIWDQVASKLKGEVAAFQKFDSHDDWNARGDTLMAEWKKVFNGEDVNLETVAEMIGYGVAFKAEHEIRMAVTEELNQKIKENERLKAAKPTGGATQGSAPNGAAELSPVDAAKKRFNDELAKARGA
jgi:hypothetical protein